MKLFIYEHITSGAYIDQALPTKLLQEGAEMLISIINDALEIEDLDITILTDYRLRSSDCFQQVKSPKLTQLSNKTSTDYQTHWLLSLQTNDIVLIIAPETDQTLLKLHLSALSHNANIIGCMPEEIEISSNKKVCSQVLSQHQLSTPQTVVAIDWPTQAFNSSTGYIIKPIDGAGCVDTYSVNSRHDVETHIAQLNKHQCTQTIIQQQIRGKHMSLTLLFAHNLVEVLSINQQLINQVDGVLILTGLIVNEFWDSTQLSLSHVNNLARQLKLALPGLEGLVGVDIIVSNDAVHIIDVNPRVTTAYTGLKVSLGINPLKRLLIVKGSLMYPLESIQQHDKVLISL
jgi:predicted ATP-grasp superfamily ATP-dependent carboligase